MNTTHKLIATDLGRRYYRYDIINIETGAITLSIKKSSRIYVAASIHGIFYGRLDLVGKNGAKGPFCYLEGTHPANVKP
jgi:hypothetical protein